MGDKDFIEQIKENNFKIKVIYTGNRSNEIVEFNLLPEDFY